MPFFSSAQKTTYAVELVQIEQQQSDELLENIPKQFPVPTMDQIVDYFWSFNIEYAWNMEFAVRDIFPYSNNPNLRFEDLSILQMILASIDLYYVTNDSYYLTNAVIDSSFLNLAYNSTFIRGEYLYPDYAFHAADNLLLVIAYARIAQALETSGDLFFATFYWDAANIVMDAIVSNFYYAPFGWLNATLRIDETTSTIENTFGHASAASTGLFTMANTLLNDSTKYYTETQNAVDYYMLNGNQTVTLADSSTGYLFQTTISSVYDNEASLQGNLYMSTALLQHSSYQEDLGLTVIASNYFYAADIYELTLLEMFRSPDTGLFHDKYDLIGSILSNSGRTFDNCLALTQIVEFYRKKYDFTGQPQGLNEILPVMNDLFNNLFVFPDFFEAGMTKTGSILYLDWFVQFRNPIIVNAQAITMLTKILPLDTMLLRNIDLRIFQDSSFEYYLKFAETTSIFGSSNKSSPIELEFSVVSATNLNISYSTFVPLSTTTLNGIKLNNEKLVDFDFNAQVGGEHDFSVSIMYSSNLILHYQMFFYIQKEIGISTDPSKLNAIQGFDKEITFTVKCLDEREVSIKSASVNVSYDTKTIGPKTTNSAGEVDINIPVSDLIPAGIVLPEDESTYNTTITISVVKDGYVSAFIEKIVIITLNSYILTLSPSPPQIKEGDDLNLYIDVKTQIEASIWTKTARIMIGETEIQDGATGLYEIPLAASVSIPYSTIKEAAAADQNGVPILRIMISTNILADDEFVFEIRITPLETLERIYSWIETALSSTWVQALASLGVLWALLWKQMRIRILKTLKRCPYCGETSKSKYAICRYCGEVINKDKLPKREEDAVEAVDTPPEPKEDNFGFQ